MEFEIQRHYHREVRPKQKASKLFQYILSKAGPVTGLELLLGHYAAISHDDPRIAVHPELGR